MDVSIIILTWNSKTLLERCLESIYENANLQFEIVLVDNGSTDSTEEFVGNKDGDVKYIRNSENHGVAGGRNQGLKVAQGKYLMILDVDTVLLPGAIDVLFEYMETHPNVGICAPKLVDALGRLQYSCAKFPSAITKIFRRVPFKWAENYLRDEYFADWDHNEVREVDYVIGACQLIRRTAFKEVGYLDNKIFYGPEDVDYCLRMWKTGWKVVYNPDSVIVHDEQRITENAVLNRIFWLHLRGLIYYFYKHGYFLSRAELYRAIEVSQHR